MRRSKEGMREKIRRINIKGKGRIKATAKTQGIKPKNNTISSPTTSTNTRRTSPNNSSRATTATKTAYSTKAGTRPKPKGSTGIITIISILIGRCHIMAKDREGKTGKKSNIMADIIS